MKQIKIITELIPTLILIIGLAGSVSSCNNGHHSKKAEKKLEEAAAREQEAAIEAYQEISRYVENKVVIYNVYEEMVYYDDAPSYVHDKMVCDVEMTNEPDERILSIEAYPVSPRSGLRYTRDASGELTEFVFGTSNYKATYPVGIMAGWRRNCTLAISCATNPVTYDDWYVEYMIHSSESNITVRYKIDSPDEFVNIITRAIDKLPAERRAELLQYTIAGQKLLMKQ